MTTTSNTLSQRCRSTQQSLFIWTFGWLVSLAAATFGPQLIWDLNKPLTIIAIAVNLLLGIKMIIANKRFLDGLDELQRKVHLNAMAVSLGVTLVFGAVAGLLEPVGLVQETPNPSNLLFVMSIAYLVSIFINNRKYQ